MHQQHPTFCCCCCCCCCCIEMNSLVSLDTATPYMHMLAGLDSSVLSILYTHNDIELFFTSMLTLEPLGHLSALGLWFQAPVLPDNAIMKQGLYSCRMRSPVRRRVSRGRSPLPPIRAGQRRPSDLRIDENTRALFLQVCRVLQLLPVPTALCSKSSIQSVSVVWHLAPHASIVLLASTAVPAWCLVLCPA